jgi:hypothetical protein
VALREYALRHEAELFRGAGAILRSGAPSDSRRRRLMQLVAEQRVGEIIADVLVDVAPA